jgi:hypothetical protein
VAVAWRWNLENVRMVKAKGEATAVNFYFCGIEKKKGIGIRHIREILDFPFNPSELLKHCRCSLHLGDVTYDPATNQGKSRGNLQNMPGRDLYLRQSLVIYPVN